MGLTDKDLVAGQHCPPLLTPRGASVNAGIRAPLGAHDCESNPLASCRLPLNGVYAAKAGVAAWDSAGGDGSPCDAAADEESASVVGEVAVAVAEAADLLNEQVDGFSLSVWGAGRRRSRQQALRDRRRRT